MTHKLRDMASEHPVRPVVQCGQLHNGTDTRCVHGCICVWWPRHEMYTAAWTAARMQKSPLPSGITQVSGALEVSAVCVIRRKQQRPGIAPNDNTMHVTTARSRADLMKRNQTPTRHTLAEDTIILQTASPQAASSQRTHVTRTQGCGRSTGG